MDWIRGFPSHRARVTGGTLRAALLRIDISAKDGVHAGEVAFAARSEPLDHIAVEAQVNRSLAGRHDDARGFPEIRAERFSFGSITARGVLAAFAESLDLAEGVSHDSRLLLHFCSPFGR